MIFKSSSQLRERCGQDQGIVLIEHLSTRSLLFLKAVSS